MIHFASHNPTEPVSQEKREIYLKALNQVLSDPEAGFVKMVTDSSWTGELKRALSHLKPSDKIAIVGTGGSILGSQAIFDSLLPLQNRVLFLSNTEEWFFSQSLNGVSPENVYWILISKSGETFETQAFIERMMHWSSDSKRALQERAVVVTQLNENELHTWAIQNQVPVVGVPKNLSGRYSVISPVGLIPAFAMGLDIQSFLKGAGEQIKDSESVVKACDAFFKSFEREEWITTQFCYSLKLRRLGDWWVQLWSESLAKKDGDRVSTPMVSVGSIDQHSQLQQFMEGARDKYFVFLSYQSSNELKVTGQNFSFFKKLKVFSLKDLLRAQLFATQNAFKQSQISFGHIEISQLSEEGLGAYFLFWELIVATMAKVLKINAYNQPGVELGKRLASDLLLNPKVEPGGRQL